MTVFREAETISEEGCIGTVSQSMVSSCFEGFIKTLFQNMEISFAFVSQQHPFIGHFSDQGFRDRDKLAAGFPG